MSTTSNLKEMSIKANDLREGDRLMIDVNRVTVTGLDWYWSPAYMARMVRVHDREFSWSLHLDSEVVVIR